MVGEDSGLEVDGLEGRPGVHSARFGGDDPVERLLRELDGVDGSGRGARYVCELVALAPGGEEVRGAGRLERAHRPRAARERGLRLRPDLRP